MNERERLLQIAAEIQEVRVVWNEASERKKNELLEDPQFFESYKNRRLSERKDQLSRTLLNQIYAGKLPKKEVVNKKKASPRFQKQLENKCQFDEIMNRIPLAETWRDLTGKEKSLFEKAIDQKVRFDPQERELYRRLNSLCQVLDEAAVDLLLKTDLEELFQEHGNTIVDEMIRKVLDYFSHQKVIPLRPFKTRSFDVIDPEDMERDAVEQFDRLNRRIEEGLLFELVPFVISGGPSLLAYLSKETSRYLIPEIDILETVKDSKHHAFWETLTSTLEEEAWEGEFLQDAAEDITTQEIENALYENPAFQAMVQELRERRYIAETMRSMILDRTPDNYADLYPAARRRKRHFVLHIGPTNSGKTYNALQALKKGESGVYLGPLRLMAFEIHERLNQEGVPCNLLTGEEHIQVSGAHHVACTIEMMNEIRHYDVAVIDEAQMAADTQRGGFWTAAILGVNADTVHVCSAPEAQELIQKIIESAGDTYEVASYERQTPLIVEKAGFSFPYDVKHGDALIVFSRKSVLYVAAELNKHNIKCGIIYGSLPYDVRQEEMRRFASGDTDVVVATDAIGMGLNLPIRRVVFLETQKYDGKTRRYLLPSEIKQIAGRAGRRGIYEKGFVTSEFDRGRIRRGIVEANKTMETAVVKFPESLIQIEGSLADILERWNGIPAGSFYEKGDITREINLARELEKICPNKVFVYSFVTIPFNEKVTLLHDLWLALFHAEWEGVDPDLSEYNLDVSEEEEDLEYLEVVYQVCDLLYYYMQRFGHEENLEEIVSIRYSTSRKIMDLIRKQGYQGKVCRNCGRELAWNYPYPICQQCFDKGRH